MRIEKDLIAARANACQNKVKFYKTYIKNAKVVRIERVTEYYTEHDFEFDYKGKRYLLTDKVTGLYSARGTYTLKEVK